MAVILKNATYINWMTLDFKCCNILTDQEDEALSFIEDDNLNSVITDLRPEVIDCTGMYVTKSFGVGHHHIYSALSRGMGAPKKNPRNFLEILQYIWWTLDKCLDEKMIESSALVAAMECAKAGATFVIDHHASPNAVSTSLEIIEEAFERVGISHLLCYEVSDRDGVEITERGLKETESYLQSHQGLVGLHASFTIGNNTLARAVEIMNRFNSGIHIHVAEDNIDQELCLRDHGKRVIERLNEAGALASSKTILAHCLHLDENERNIIRHSPCWVAENCESNMNNNVGYFNGTGLGDKIMLGTDGMHSDMLQSTKAAFFSGQRHDNINYLSAYQRFRNIHNYLAENNYTGDSDNNLVVLDYSSPTEFNKDNFSGHFIFGLTSNNVRHVISRGRIIVKDRQITRVDENEITSESKKHAKRLWDKMKQS